jgi:GMP synthase (glutamine-hydrolysing)
MKRAVVIQHVEMEGPGRIAELLVEHDVKVDIVEVFAGAPVPTAIGHDEILVVMGGGMGVGDREDARYPFLNPEIALLKRALADGRGVLGVCLGSQLLACAAGAPVYPMSRLQPDGRETPRGEVGWGQVRLLEVDAEPALAGLGREQTVLHWHGDTYDLPSGAVRLASSDVCPNQAFRLGTRAFGLQFHVEADRELASRWAVEDADFARKVRGPDAVAAVIAESARLAETARAAGDRMIRNIIGCMLA